MAAVGVASTSTCMGRRKLRVLASWNISPTPLPVIVDPKKSSKKKPNPLKTQFDTTPTSIKKKKNHLAVFQLLTANRTTTQEKVDDLYLGYERWLPAAPQVKSPKSIYNATSLAYVGDCIYELYARRHFLFPPLSMDDYNDRVKEVVRCEAQDALLKKLCDDDFLSEEERDVLRWGKNIGSGKTKTKKRAGVAVYNRASSLETLVGYLYLTNVERLEELMLKLGFSTGASTERIL